jgi:hypothetical protein
MGLHQVEQQDSLIHRLLVLRALDFHFVTNHDPKGLLVALVGVRTHRGVIDVIQLYGEHDADAIRIPGDEPDIMFPCTVLWRATGSAGQVIDNLLDLRDP